jgi:hypothetical protein
MQPLSWYLNRLSLMSPAEMTWRVSHVVRDRLERSFGGVPQPAADARRIDLPSWAAPDRSSPAEYVSAAREILDGRVDLFGEPVQVGFPDARWNRDPVSGVLAPLGFGKAIDYRDARIVGSARNIWEVNRHFQLVTLAQAGAVTGDAQYREAVLRLLESWVRECPYPNGPNWSSALEHGIRLISWYLSARLLGLTAAEHPPGWLTSIYQHCRFIVRNRSRHSSANNHLIGEVAGLYLATCAWPCWRESLAWRAEARRVLEAEARRQVHADGVTREQTVGYQIFVLHFLLVAGLAGETHGDPFPAEYWTTVRRMMGFLRSIADRRGNLPDFGDSDDGMALTLSPRARQRKLPDLLELDEALAAPQLADYPPESLTAWLLQGFRAPAAWPAGPARVAREFPRGGYYVLASGRGEPGEVQLVFDSAPLGYLSIAAHGHADCLSFVLSVDGHPLLVDPGTFCYHDDPGWRDYFRSTAAHNTVRVDGQDQSVMGGPFMWLRKASPRVETVELEAPVQRIRASHEGYCRLADPVIHAREVALDAAAGRVTVRDELRCRAGHQVERYWHFPPRCKVQLGEDGVLRAAVPGVILEMRCPDAAIELLSGHRNPRAGWFSPRFGSLQRSTTAVCRSRVSGTTLLQTTFEWRLAQENEPEDRARVDSSLLTD